jgi:hypothetical protein
MKLSPRILAAALMASGALLAHSARADDGPRAKELFDRAVAAFDAGNLDQACPAFDESFRLDPRPGTLFALATCEEKRGHLASALRRYDDYLAQYSALTPEKKVKQGDREKVSRTQRAALLPQVPELTLTLPPNAPLAMRVTRDGVVVERVDLGRPLRVDPGEHVITAEVPGAAPSTVRVTLALRERRTLAVALPRGEGPPMSSAAQVGPVVEPPPPRAPSDGTNVRLIAGSTVLGVGVVMGVTGLVSALQVNSGANAVNALRTKVSKPASFDWCSPADAQANGLTSACSKIHTFTPLEFASFGIAAAAGGVGIWLLATSRPAASSTAGWVVTPRIGRGVGGLDAAVRF